MNDDEPVRRIIVFGNSGSGKSTLAARLGDEGLAHLDLDLLAWLPTSPPSRLPPEKAFGQIREFMAENPSWVIEGCYADLLEILEPYATEAVFMNLPVELCQQNARKRPWEPSKYASPEAQDANLPMLLDWIAGYPDRGGPLSYGVHRALFMRFRGQKTEFVCNREAPVGHPREEHAD